MQDSHATHSDSQVEIAWGTDLPSTYLTHYTLGMMIMREKAVGMDHHKEELEVKETSLICLSHKGPQGCATRPHFLAYSCISSNKVTHQLQTPPMTNLNRCKCPCHLKAISAGLSSVLDPIHTFTILELVARGIWRRVKAQNSPRLRGDCKSSLTAFPPNPCLDLLAQTPMKEPQFPCIPKMPKLHSSSRILWM